MQLTQKSFAKIFNFSVPLSKNLRRPGFNRKNALVKIPARKTEGTDPGASFIFAAIMPYFAKISAARLRQHFIPVPSPSPFRFLLLEFPMSQETFAPPSFHLHCASRFFRIKFSKYDNREKGREKEITVRTKKSNA